MKILVIRFDQRQDVFLLGGFLLRLRKEYPVAEIFLMTYEKNHDVVSTWDFIDDIVIYHPEKDIFRKWAFVSILRKVDFDIVFDMQNDQTTRFLSRLIKKKALYKLESSPERHLIEDYFDILKNISIEPEVSSFNYRFPDGFCYRIGKVRPPLLVIAPFSEEGMFEWGIDRYLYIAGRFNEATGGDVAIVGKKEDKERSRPFFVYDFIYNLPGDADLIQNLWVVKNCTIFLGGSSEFTQAASGFGIPVIAIYDKKDLIKHYPVSDNARIFQGENKELQTGKEISGIDEENVIEAIVDLLVENK